MKNSEYTWATIKVNEEGEYFFSESSKYDGGREPEVTFVVKRNLLNNTHVDVNDVDRMQEVYLHELNIMTEVHVELLKENDNLKRQNETLINERSSYIKTARENYKRLERQLETKEQELVNTSERLAEAQDRVRELKQHAVNMRERMKYQMDNEAFMDFEGDIKEANKILKKGEK